MTLRIVGDSDSEYLVADVLNDDGEPEVVQLARFESEKARRLYERLHAEEVLAHLSAALGDDGD